MTLHFCLVFPCLQVAIVGWNRRIGRALSLINYLDKNIQGFKWHVYIIPPTGLAGLGCCFSSEILSFLFGFSFPFVGLRFNTAWAEQWAEQIWGEPLHASTKTKIWSVFSWPRSTLRGSNWKQQIYVSKVFLPNTKFDTPGPLVKFHDQIDERTLTWLVEKSKGSTANQPGIFIAQTCLKVLNVLPPAQHNLHREIEVFTILALYVAQDQMVPLAPRRRVECFLTPRHCLSDYLA